MSKGLSPTAQKIILLLLGGVTLSLIRSPAKYSRIFKILERELKNINRDKIYRAVKKLYESKLISYAEQSNGIIKMVLSRNGKKEALYYSLDDMAIPKPKKWDKKWRVVLFDIPETHKNLRDTLRQRLKFLRFVELQKSVFVYPFECQDEIDFIIELYNARRFVRFIEAVYIDNEFHLKQRFKLE